VRPQTHLHTTALHAHVESNTLGTPDAVKASKIKSTATCTLSRLMKVACEVSYVPVVLLVCGLTHLLMARPSQLALSGAVAAAAVDKAPSALMCCITGFLGWWASLVYVGWASVGLLMARLHAGGADSA
jgi:hypothetical protein